MPLNKDLPELLGLLNSNEVEDLVGQAVLFPRESRSSALPLAHPAHQTLLLLPFML
jgi:hypothetical protein